MSGQIFIMNICIQLIRKESEFQGGFKLCFTSIFSCYGADKIVRPLHTESEFFIWNFRTLKNKYDLTLCQSHLHTASEIFVRHKKIRIGFDFLPFSPPWQAFWEVFWQFRATVEANAKIQNGDCQVDPLRLAAQSTVYRSLHTDFTEIGGLLFNMWL